MLEHLRSLAVFARTVETGSFRGAARALNLSPSVVSHHISELERRLALPLLYRSTRRLSLTPDGERLLVAAREMLAAAERGLDEVSGRSASPSGLLRVTAPAFLATTSVSRDLAAFCEAHPRVKLTMSFTEERRDLLRDNLDLALRAGILEDSAHRSRKLATLHRVLVASPRYLRPRAPQTLQDLAGCDLLQLLSRPAELVVTPPGKKQPQSLPFSPRIAVDSAAAMRELALAGAGIAGLPELIVRADLARGRLVEVLPGWRMPPLGVYAVWPANAQRPGLTLRFLDFMEEPLARLFAAPAESPA
jgi:DNA-binding transcriptional LysR family regulator